MLNGGYIFFWLFFWRLLVLRIFTQMFGNDDTWLLLVHLNQGAVDRSVSVHLFLAFGFFLFCFCRLGFRCVWILNFDCEHFFLGTLGRELRKLNCRLSLFYSVLDRSVLPPEFLFGFFNDLVLFLFFALQGILTFILLLLFTEHIQGVLI